MTVAVAQEELPFKIAAAAAALAAAQRVVCLTGAGVSAESGVATFRAAQTGLWTRFDPEQLASQAGFAADPGLVWRWYMQRLAAARDAKPNPGHIALAQLEAIVPKFTLVTQNVDDLHEQAGSRAVLHLHGNLARFRCNNCGFEHVLKTEDREAEAAPVCVLCGALVRPDVVWFGEALPQRILQHAWLEAERCDVALVVGTSGAVYPAAQLPLVARQAGAILIDVNPEATPLSQTADLFLAGPSGAILPEVLRQIRDPN